MEKELNKNNLTVISLGGSLIVPESGVDAHFLVKFRKLIIQRIQQGQRFVIVAGGGRTARDYQRAANKVARLTNDDGDWLGIHATRLNAHLIKTIFRGYVHPRINKNPRTKENLSLHFKNKEGLMVAAGWRPGWSTDYVATILADRLGAKTIINLSDIEYVYDKNPKKYKQAKKIKSINWKSFRRLIGNKWDPGANLPFDPVAAKFSELKCLKVIILNGRKIKNFEKCLDNKKFVGTIIS